jgi:hypothetical protein
VAVGAESVPAWLLARRAEAHVLGGRGVGLLGRILPGKLSDLVALGRIVVRIP